MVVNKGRAGIIYRCTTHPPGLAIPVHIVREMRTVSQHCHLSETCWIPMVVGREHCDRVHDKIDGTCPTREGHF